VNTADDEDNADYVKPLPPPAEARNNNARAI
jgi:hypothetical protein